MCVWSAYAGKKQAAPILLEALKKTEGYWAGFYTGMATCENGVLHFAKCPGHTGFFEKNFDVFTNDEVDARYLITPTFMERIKNLELAFKADKIKCAFYNKWLIIALSTKKDLFSICSLTKPICDNNQYFQMYEEIESIIKLIDYFKLDQKIGL